MQVQGRTGKKQSETNLRLRKTSFQPAGQSVRYARGKRERSLPNTYDAVKRIIRPNCGLALALFCEALFDASTPFRGQTGVALYGIGVRGADSLTSIEGHFTSQSNDEPASLSV
jgi:hypothetical protein